MTYIGVVAAIVVAGGSLGQPPVFPMATENTIQN